MVNALMVFVIVNLDILVMYANMKILLTIINVKTTKVKYAH